MCSFLDSLYLLVSLKVFFGFNFFQNKLQYLLLVAFGR